MWSFFRCTVCLFGVVFGVRCAVFWADFGARCVERRSWGPISVHGAPFWFDFGALPFRDRFWCVVRWCGVDHSQRATRCIKIGEDLGGIEPETCRIWGLGPWRMMPFRVDFGARCAFSGSRFWCAVRRFWGGFWCAVRRFLGLDFGARYCGCADFGADFGARSVVFGLDFGARCAVFGLDFAAWCVVRRFWGRFRARCAFLGSFLARRFWVRFWCTVCGAPILGADFVALGAPCVAFLGSILVRALRLPWMIDACWVDHSQRATRSISRLERTWGEWIWALVLAHDALLGGFWCEVRLFGLGFGVRCAVFGLDFGARCAVFGWILVRGMWCADFGADFGARCVVFGLDFGAPVRRFWARFRCTVRLFGLARLERTWGNRARDLSNMRGIWSWRMMPFRVDFGARCAFLGSVLCAMRRFWGGFWCAVRRFWAGFWCAVCGAPILGPISVHGASFFGLDFGARCAVFGLDFGADFGARCAFLGSFLVCGAPFLGSILVHGVWCADFGADFGARCAFLGSILARCLFGIDFGIDFGAWCADVGGRSQPAGNKIYQNIEHLLFSALLGTS